MLTLKDVEHGITFYATVELGGELSFPIGLDYEQAAERLQSVAGQIGGYVKRDKILGQPSLTVYPPNVQGYWRLTWRDEGLEVARFNPETQTFPRQQ
jgi:hypothetical protein